MHLKVGITWKKAFPNNQRELLSTGMLIKSDEGKIYDRYRNRIMFPIHDRNGRVIGFGGRVLDKDQKPKYLNSPETVLFQKSRELYGLHQVLSQQKNPDSIIVVEGYMDVIALAQHGILMWWQHWELPPAHSIYNYWQSIPNISFFALMVIRQVNKQPGEHWRAVYRI